MSDRLRIVDFDAGGRAFGVLDLEQVDLPLGEIMKERGSFAIDPPAPQRVDAKASRRFAGSRQVGELHDNGRVRARWLVKGADEQGALEAFGAFVDACSRARPGRYIEWRPDGHTKSTYYELRGTADWKPEYLWAQWKGAKALVCEASFPVAPLALGDHMDVFDDFSAADALSDYRQEAGVWSLSGGRLVPPSGTSRLYHEARGYRYADVQITAKLFYNGPAPASQSVLGLTLKGLDGDDRLYARLLAGDPVANDSIRFVKVDAGVSTAIGVATNVTPEAAVGSTYWLRGRVAGNVLTVEWWTAAPTPSGTPAVSVSHVLTGAEATKWGEGVEGQPGLLFESLETSGEWQVDELSIEPLTYTGAALPAVLRLPKVPGDAEAPALVDVKVTHSGGAAAPAWAALGWWRRPGAHNLVWNGNSEDDVNGWTVAAVSNIIGAATSITRVTSASKYGAASAQIVTPGAGGAEGAAFRMSGPFRRGITYTARLWARQSAGTAATARPRLGHDTSVDRAIGAGVALSANFQEMTVTWTPTADRDYAYVAFESGATAVAGTFQIDGVEVYEGTVAPTLTTQTEGRGAVPPVGVIQAEAAAAVTGWAITTDADYRGGSGIQATASGAGSASAEWLVDPALLEADDFTACELAVELWARVELASGLVSPKLTLSARPDAGTAYGAERWSNEWGSAGRSLTKPSAGTTFRLVRLGTLTFYVDPDSPARWRLRLAGSWAAASTGTFGVDQLLALPIARRALSGPTGRALNSSYPKFVQSTAETTKLLRSDGSGAVAKPPGPYFPDVGMSRPLELPSGDVEVLLALSSLVPDDPTADSSSEQEDHAATAHFAVRPRYHLARAA